MSKTNQLHRAVLFLAICTLTSSAATGQTSPLESSPASSELMEAFIQRDFSAELVARVTIAKDLSGTNERLTLVFATLHDTVEQSEETRPRNFVPVILTFDGARWGMIETPFRGCAWQYAGRLSQGKWVYAILDNAVEAPGNDLSIVASDDSGVTWRHLANIGKPWYMTGLDRFTMDEQGHGTLSIYHDTSNQDPSRTTRGYYTAITEDGGAHWSNYTVTECDLEGGYTNRVVVLHSVEERTTHDDLARIEQRFREATKADVRDSTR